MARKVTKQLDPVRVERMARMTAHIVGVFAESEMKRSNTLPHEILADNVARAAVRLAIKAEQVLHEQLEALQAGL